MIIRVVVGELEGNCYIFFDDKNNNAMIVDPGAEPEKIDDILSSKGLIPIIIVNTHYHFDHVGGNSYLKKKYNIPIAIGELDANSLKRSHIEAQMFMDRKIAPSPEADILLSSGERITVGKTVFKVIHTPGHTPGSICLYSENLRILFSGDTLFFESVGRWDLLGGSELNLRKSIEKLFKLPCDTKVYPGHGPYTTVEHEKNFNPFFNF